LAEARGGVKLAQILAADPGWGGGWGGVSISTNPRHNTQDART